MKKQNSISRRKLIVDSSKLLGAAAVTNKFPEIIIKKKPRIRVLGTHVTLQEELRTRASKELNIDIEFYPAGSAAVLQKAAANPASFDLYEQWSDSINILWSAKAIQPIEISELKYWKLSENDKKIMDKWDVFTLYKDRMFKKTGRDNSPWVIINSNNKMIARLTALRYFLNKTDYENKKILKPAKYSETLSNYSATIEGVKFDNLSYEQFMIITKYSDDA